MISVTAYDGRVIATDKETGKVVWDKNLRDQPDVELTAAPLALKDSIIDRRLRRRPRRARLDRLARSPRPATPMEDLFDPGAGRARQRDLEGQEQRLADRRRRVLRHRLLRSGQQPDLLGLRQSGAGLRFVATGRATTSTPSSAHRPRCRDSGKFNWYFQYTPNDNRDYDETGTHILIDTKVNGEDRKIVSHAGRNGFNYTFDRAQRPVPQGQPSMSSRSPGPRASIPRPASRSTTIPARTSRSMPRAPTSTTTRRRGRSAPTSPAAPTTGRRPTAAKTKLLYIPALKAAPTVTPDHAAACEGQVRRRHHRRRRAASAAASRCSIRSTGEIKKRADFPYPNFAGIAVDRRRHRGHRRCSTAPSWRSTTRRSTSCGGSTSAPASMRRR